MTLADVTRSAVLAALAEYDRLGQDEFLQLHGFGKAQAYYLEHGGKLYDSKAIVGAAHGISGDRPWRSDDLTGGDKSVGETLRRLGFTVRFIRNPAWTRDEVILACALVEANAWRTIAQEDARAIELSRLLQTSAIHPLQGRRADFRNPAGVERKTSDIVTQHPDYAGTPTNGNRLDREVLLDFLQKPAEMHAMALAIRDTLSSWDSNTSNLSDATLDDTGAEEGGVLYKKHLRRERDPRLRSRKIADARRRGIPIECEACGFNFGRTYGDRGADYIECHHRTPLHVTGRTVTRLSDLALICSNCHRMIHHSKPWLAVEELRDLVAAHR
ncbi:HNH endonuclease [Solwaraspora sp. WMMD791]|uniref:HNH endonuclease n=1 Tax=Solwaraspora sp. WMMD791 TaxID=3016086 RepID=UPI00249C0AB4|nr:HNH endonuclease [Solwaraspora sp. WMMD791]WFE25906.1 HNH endonuclease [Solwaraspora sp. WMMD791]